MINHVTGMQVYAHEGIDQDRYGNLVGITVFHSKTNRAYNHVSIHSIYRVMACIKYLIVSCPDTRMIGMKAEVQE
jgi:hypothetical protein